MAAFDYTTVQEVKAYVDSQGTTDDSLLPDLVTGVSRAIDRVCHQVFYAQTLVDDTSARALIDRDGILICFPATPLISSLSAAAYRIAPNTSWQAIDVSTADIENAPSGATLRFPSTALGGFRDRRVQLKLSMACGYASRDVMPDDLVWYARLAAAAEYAKRAAAGGDATAMPALGVVVTPRDWPPNVRRGLSFFTRHVS
jgi:hypothetical protein